MGSLGPHKSGGTLSPILPASASLPWHLKVVRAFGPGRSFLRFSRPSLSRLAFSRPVRFASWLARSRGPARPLTALPGSPRLVRSAPPAGSCVALGGLSLPPAPSVLGLVALRAPCSVALVSLGLCPRSFGRSPGPPFRPPSGFGARGLRRGGLRRAFGPPCLAVPAPPAFVLLACSARSAFRCLPLLLSSVGSPLSPPVPFPLRGTGRRKAYGPLRWDGGCGRFCLGRACRAGPKGVAFFSFLLPYGFAEVIKGRCLQKLLDFQTNV